MRAATFFLCAVSALLIGKLEAFVIHRSADSVIGTSPMPTSSLTAWNPRGNKQQKQTVGKQIRSDRRKQLGIPDDADEYDLDAALNNNTDDFISKVVAGSFIVAVIVLLVAGIIIPATADLGDEVCKPILNGGRC